MFYSVLVLHLRRCINVVDRTDSWCPMRSVAYNKVLAYSKGFAYITDEYVQTTVCVTMFAVPQPTLGVHMPIQASLGM